jgi:hypothetical protein
MRERWCGEPVKSYAAAAGLVVAAFFVLFLLGEVASVPLLTDPSGWLHEAGVPPALVGVGLLVVDAVLPVPSSLVMIALGAVYGAVLGTLLAAIGTMGATLVGFALEAARSSSSRSWPWLAARGSSDAPWSAGSCGTAHGRSWNPRQ